MVTGTLTCGAIAVDDQLQAGDHAVRVRGIQQEGRAVDAAAPGERVALNLVGVDHHHLERGDAVVRPDQWRAVEVVDVEVTELPGELRIVRGGKLDPKPIPGWPADKLSARSMNSVVLHPDFARNRTLYFSYVKHRDGGDTTVALARELKARGVDVIACSSGGINGPLNMAIVQRTPGYQVPYAERVRREAAGAEHIRVNQLVLSHGFRMDV